MKIVVEHEIDTIDLYPGEMFTIWLNTRGPHDSRHAVQVEVRVKKDGTPEIFTHLAEARVADFKDWHSDIPPEPHIPEPVRKAFWRRLLGGGVKR